MRDSYSICVQCNARVTLHDIHIKTDLRNRGFDEDTLRTMPDYHWRDDSLRIWESWSDTLPTWWRWYLSDEAIVKDVELQEWVRNCGPQAVWLWLHDWALPIR